MKKLKMIGMLFVMLFLVGILPTKAHAEGWVQEEKPQYVDLHRLGGWLKSDRSPVKMQLKEMNRAQLSKIIFALQQIIKSQYK